MKNLTIGIYFSDEEGNICLKRELSRNWTVNDDQGLQKNHSKYFFDEVANILTENIKESLTTDVVKNMFKEMIEGENNE
jgi:hypothetical protein